MSQPEDYTNKKASFIHLLRGWLQDETPASPLSGQSTLSHSSVEL
jgi:hypothetical protein